VKNLWLIPCNRIVGAKTVVNLAIYRHDRTAQVEAVEHFEGLNGVIRKRANNTTACSVLQKHFSDQPLEKLVTASRKFP
jgi:hypothetical protein